MVSIPRTPAPLQELASAMAISVPGSRTALGGRLSAYLSAFTLNLNLNLNLNLVRIAGLRQESSIGSGPF